MRFTKEELLNEFDRIVDFSGFFVDGTKSGRKEWPKIIDKRRAIRKIIEEHYEEE